MKIVVNFGLSNFNSIIKQEVQKEKKIQIKQFKRRANIEIKTQTDEINSILSGNDIKFKISQIINNEDQSKKVIDNLKLIKNKRKDEMHLRGNFMQKNV